MSRSSLSSSQQFIIEFSSRIKDEGQRRIEKICGYEIGWYMGENCYVMNCEIEKIEMVEEMEEVVYVGMYKNEHKYRSDGGMMMRKRRMVDDDEEEEEGEGGCMLAVLFEKSIKINDNRRNVMERFKEMFERLYGGEEEEKGGGVRVQIASKEKVLINYCKVKEKEREIIEYLSSLNYVHFIEKYSMKRIKNKNMKWIIQTNKENEYLDYGYNGEGEVIGIGDSGLDINNCYFYDKDNRVNFIKYPENDYQLDDKHRKVATYWNLIDEKWDSSGHGTHCAGTIAGEYNTDTFKDYNGVADKSRLFFIDLGCNTDGGCNCSQFEGCICNLYDDQKCTKSGNYVYPPVNLNDYYFKFPYEQGVRILSNSWGGASTGYSMSTREIDQFCWEHKDFLPIFAAGNSGHKLGLSSLDTEAECKNCLTVGCSMNSIESYIKIENDFKSYESLKDNFVKQSTIELSCNIDCLVKNESIQTCNYLNSVDFDCCSTKGFLCNQTENDKSKNLCGCSFKNGYGRAGDYCCKECVINHYNEVNNITKFPQNMAYFSSQGPSVDYRIKPDIVSVGYFLLSAKADRESTHCNQTTSLNDQITYKAGTSMSTPSTAGAIGVIREYLRKYKNIDNPSSSLLKALVINSGEELSGEFYSQNTYFSFSDFTQEVFFNKKFIEGFGRIKLNNILFNENLHILTKKSIRTDEIHCYIIRNNHIDNSIKATLVWSDFPSIPSKLKHLVNDLNLIMIYNEDDFLYGNSESENVFQRDNVNNVEQISVNGIKNSSFIIVVEGYDIPMNLQPYSLVISSKYSLEISKECNQKDGGFVEKKLGVINPPEIPCPSTEKCQKCDKDMTDKYIADKKLSQILSSVHVLTVILIIVMIILIISCILNTSLIGYFVYDKFAKSKGFFKLKDEQDDDDEEGIEITEKIEKDNIEMELIQK